MRSSVVSREGVTEEELKRAKTQLNAQLVFDRDSITNIAHQLGYFGTVATTDLFTGVGSSIAGVTVEQVGDAARELSGLRTAPSAGSTRCRSAKVSSLKAQVPHLESEEQMTSRFETSDLKLETSPPGLDPIRTTLDNGVVVIAKQTRKTPAVTLSLAMRAGSDLRPAGCTWRDEPAGPRDRSRHDEQVRRGDRRRHRQPWHFAHDHRHPPPVLDRRHLPGRGFRGDLRPSRRHPDGSDRSRVRACNAEGRNHHGDPSG